MAAEMMFAERIAEITDSGYSDNSDYFHTLHFVVETCAVSWKILNFWTNLL